MIVELKLPGRQAEFLASLERNCSLITSRVARHLNINNPAKCHLSPRDEWILGSFNVCIPVTTTDISMPRLIMRFALPYKIGELDFPGNVDEKIKAEAATYIWLDQHCPTVPKPHLLGFGCSDGRCVSNASV